MKIGELSVHDKHAQNWWDGSRYFLRMLANQVHARIAYFERVAPEWEGVSTLDLGCGGGFMAEALASRGARVTGIDPWIAVLRIARVHSRTQKLDIQYIGGAGESLPLSDNCFDRVVSVDVLEHVLDLRGVLAEIYRVLRPGGLFFFDTVNRTWASRLLAVNLLEDVLRIMPKGMHDPAKFIRPNELRTELEALGFQVAPMVGMGPVRLNHRLEPVFGLLPFKSIMYLGYAVK
ncbi:MAG: 3-demethylubiquinone-9 3-O-methyltransferase [Dehalococcoidia bacterium]|nr:MAG: 3-demethylubiquinone-9 3-O-methyltransferase [Dehalococcoidia bacterium]